MKTRLISLIIFILTCGYIKADKSINNIKIGGCGTPIFLNNYDISTIKKLNQVNNVKHIQISYPLKLKDLAYKVRNNLKQSEFVELDQIEDMHDTPSIHYRHDVIIIQVCF